MDEMVDLLGQHRWQTPSLCQVPAWKGIISIQIQEKSKFIIAAILDAAIMNFDFSWIRIQIHSISNSICNKFSVKFIANVKVKTTIPTWFHFPFAINWTLNWSVKACKERI